MPFVLDASVAAAWIFEDEVSPDTQSLLDSLDLNPAFAPAHWPVEIVNVLQVGVKKGRVTSTGAFEFIRRLENLPISVMPMTIGLSTLFMSASTHHLTAYDAAYLELAVERGLPLATKDKELRAAANKAGVKLLF